MKQIFGAQLFCALISYNVLMVVPELENGPFKIIQQRRNCTQQPNLPCVVKSEEWLCPFEDKIPIGWPGQVENLAASHKYVPFHGHCWAQLNVSWIIPNDYSAMILKGFQVNVIAMSGENMNIQVCATFNMSKANVTRDDIRKKVAYHYDDVLLSPGKYAIMVYTLPKPEMGGNDKYVQLDIDIGRAYYVDSNSIGKSKCVLPHSTTIGPTQRPTTTTSSSPPGPSVRAVTEEGFWSHRMKLAVGIGSGVGLTMVVVLIIVIRRPCDRKTRTISIDCPPENDEGPLLQGPYDDLEEPGDSVSAQIDFSYQESANSDGNNELQGAAACCGPPPSEPYPQSYPVDPPVNCPHSWPRPNPCQFVPPINPDDMSSTWSRALSEINARK